MNAIYSRYGQNANNPYSDIINRAKNFRQMFSVDPRAEVQRLLNSGQMTQEQFNQLQAQAQQILPYLH